jgi:hypothetical protein
MGDTIDDFAVRISKLATDLRGLGKESHMVTDSSSSFGAKDGGGGHYAKKDKTRARGGDMHDSGAKLTSMGTPRRKGKCRKCGIYGHWGKECKKAPKEEHTATLSKCQFSKCQLGYTCSYTYTHTVGHAAY